MDSTRIFIRGLPPNMGAGDFKHHFSKGSDITDARLILHRRIGYVGFKTPEDAIKAAKYHNKSFINMSRIKVELARSVDQELALKPRDNVHHTVNGQKTTSTEQTIGAEKPSLKRKRDVHTGSEKDSKLQEYMEVMQPASKSRTWANEDAKVDQIRHQDIMINVTTDKDSLDPTVIDPESQETLKKQKKSRKDAEEASHTPKDVMPPDVFSENTDSAPPPATESPAESSEVSKLADDEWLRSRTSRLLGLVDEDNPKNQRAGGPENPSKEESPQKCENRLSSELSDVGALVDDSGVRQEFKEATHMPGVVNGTETATDRLFLRNLPYTATDDEIRHHFKQFGYGIMEEVHVPIDHKSGKNKGFAYVKYSTPELATKAQQGLDGKLFQGRLLHIISSAAKRQSGLDDFAIAKLPLKKQQQIKRKATAASSIFNWNSMYMNADAVMSSISDRLGVPKSELLDPTSADAAVKQAHAETHVIQETKRYFSANGVDLDAFKSKEAGDSAILVKNFPYGTKPDELQRMFEVYGTIRRLLMPPSGTIAIVDFVQPDHARSAFGGLAYRKFRESVLFLEKAPKNVFAVQRVTHAEDKMSSGIIQSARQPAGDLLEGALPQQSVNTSTLFVRNLNFSTTSERLREIFKHLDGFLSARVKTKADPKNASQVLSMGFGFLEFKSKEQAQAALVAMDGYNLDNHELLIRASHKGVDAAEERRREDNAKKLAGRRTKVIIKNLPFEASKKDVRSLFGAYGQLRSVRVPKKFDSSTRGFAFAEFVTAREAENAMDALKDTHLLGRRLVIDFAAEDEIDPEQEIAKMLQKTGKQADKVALQRLVGTGRKRFNVEGHDDIDRD